MSDDLIAIGDDGSGDKLCLKKINGKMGDIIYLWNHETTELDEYAPSLEDFIILISEDNGDFDYE